MPTPGRGLAPDVKAFIHDNYRGTPFNDLVRLVQDRFGEDSTYKQIRGYVHNNKLWNGLDGRIRPGNVPHNKGSKKWWAGGEQTQFKKGNKPANYMPVGSERVNADGYLDVKIADPNKWTQVHLLIWEAVHGPIPPGHIVTFADSDPMNVHPDNLLLITRNQHARLNQRHLRFDDGDLTRAGVAIADIAIKIAEKKKARR